MEDNASLPFGSSLCGTCEDACPVKIPMPEILVHLLARKRGGDEATIRSLPWPLSAWTTSRDVPAVPRAYEGAGGRTTRPTDDALVALFVERVEDHRATVLRCGPDGVAAAIATGLGSAWPGGSSSQQAYPRPGARPTARSWGTTRSPRRSSTSSTPS